MYDGDLDLLDGDAGDERRGVGAGLTRQAPEIGHEVAVGVGRPRRFLELDQDRGRPGILRNQESTEDRVGAEPSPHRLGFQLPRLHLLVRHHGDRAQLVPFEIAHVGGRQNLDDLRERLHPLGEPIDALEGFWREQPVGVQRDDDHLVGAESRVERAERIEVAAPRRDHGLHAGIDLRA